GKRAVLCGAAIAAGLLVPRSAYAPLVLQISNQPTAPTNMNAQDLADNLVGSNMALNGTTSVDVVESVEVSDSSFGSQTGNLYLQAPTVNIGGDIQFGSGQLQLNGTTVNLNGSITVNGALMRSPELVGTATQVNVLSPKASIAQALAIAAPGATIHVS